ncbi:hypothetical protein O0L34_g17728 [Tuta absoluta]|nr:hypothetical protein O0L34_g17728 [Tuta absoluta]
MAKYVEEKGKLYEIKANGEKELVRSSESEKRVYLRFTNKTSRPINVWWRDFSGTKHHYLCLDPGSFSDINSYVTHPWQFTDPATNESFVINNQLIYRAAPNLGEMMYRTNWNITVRVRTLKFSAMLAIAECLSSPQAARQLQLPKSLETEVEKMARDLLMEES